MSGLREQVKKGEIGLDEAIEIAKDYNESIRAWLMRRKKGNVKSSVDKKKPGKKKKQYRKKKRRN